MLEVQLIDPNGYDVPFAHLPISSPTDAQQAGNMLLAVEAPRHAATSGVGYSPRQYTVKTRPAPSYSVVVVRPGLPAVALGSYRSPEFAGLTAWNLTHHLGESSAFITVEPHDEDLPHLPMLPTDPQQLADHLDVQAGLDVHARLAAQVGTKAAGLLLADAYLVRATALRAA
jgi:hypothetical protein